MFVAMSPDQFDRFQTAGGLLGTDRTEPLRMRHTARCITDMFHGISSVGGSCAKSCAISAEQAAERGFWPSKIPCSSIA